MVYTISAISAPNGEGGVMHSWKISVLGDDNMNLKFTANREMPMKAQRVGGGLAPTHSQAFTRRQCVVSTTLRPLYLPERSGNHCARGWTGFVAF